MVLRLGVVVAESTPTSRQDLQAYDALFADARERLLRICAGLVGAIDAEDVVQEAYLRGRRNFRQLRAPIAFDAWMTRIAVNLCLSGRRRDQAFRARIPRLVSPIHADVSDAGLIELIEGLPPRERAVLVLVHGYGYGLQEIARLLGLSHTNARTIVLRARRRLAERWLEAER